MAGVFGFLDFTREGPGVDKNAPKKRSFVTFFEIYRRKFWALICASLWYLLFKIPVITTGLAEVGLTFITRNYSREKHAFIRADFFETIKKNWKQALPCGIINLTVTALLVNNIVSYVLGLFPELITLLPGEQTVAEPLVMSTMDFIVFGCSLFGYVVFTFMKYYIPFLVVTFRLRMGQVYRNAMIFSMAGLKRNLLISAVLMAVYGLMLLILGLLPYQIVYWLVFLFALLVLPGFRSLLIQFTIFPVIKELMIDPYYAANPDADKQQRRDLNLDVEESETEEAVFTDDAASSKEQNTFPHQYSESELRRLAVHRRSQSSAEDDDTI